LYLLDEHLDGVNGQDLLFFPVQKEGDIVCQTLSYVQVSKNIGRICWSGIWENH
jgi:hypothetical protein